MTKTADRFMWGADFCIIKTDRALICIYMMNSYKLIQKKRHEIQYNINKGCSYLVPGT